MLKPKNIMITDVVAVTRDDTIGVNSPDSQQRGEHPGTAKRFMLRADGSQVPVLKSLRRILVNGQEKFLKTIIDISDRKRETPTRDAMACASLDCRDSAR